MEVFTHYPLKVGGDEVAELDPLGVDGLLPELWKMNEAADVNGLVTTLRSLLPTPEEIGRLSLAGRAAAMRDVGMYVGSIRRHGAEPVQAVAGLEGVLLGLSAGTGMIPRDTVHHYIGWNPIGARERMYTGLHMERMLMASVRITLSRLSGAVDVCRGLNEADPADWFFAVQLNELVALLRSLEDSIDLVMANVTPEFFAKTMRPYFEEIQVGGETYLGPAAAHVPLSLIDLAVWASDADGAAYNEFWRESMHYGLPSWRPLYVSWSTNASMVTRVKWALEEAPVDNVPRNLRAAAEALCRALRAMVVFRGKHFTVARQAYADDIALYSLGSGGGSLELLDSIVSLTRENANLLRKSLARAGGPVVKSTAGSGPAQEGCNRGKATRKAVV